MTPPRTDDQFDALARLAVELAHQVKADALLVLVDRPVEWAFLQQLGDQVLVIVAASLAEQMAGAAEAGLKTVLLGMDEGPVHGRLARALLEAIADEYLQPGARAVALYAAFEAGELDSLSVIDLGDHLGRLTIRDLRRLETSVPLDTLKEVVDLALEIGFEGREGKPVGTMFVVGDHRAVLSRSHELVFDPFKGYKRTDRNLHDPKVREAIKEIAQMDGAFVVATDGTMESACRHIDAPAEDITLSKGLGARHWAAAAISNVTDAVAVAVSESSGTVRIFQNGEVVLRIEPFRRPMKWKELEYEPPERDD
jgi:DNA integrity scanning protein DisA with diadenylate cyclase activity